MTPERWREISDALDQALLLASLDRPAFLRKLGVSDPDLQREVESLLTSHAQADSAFLQTPLQDVQLPFELPAHTDSLLAKRLGFYEIFESIGEGGMGEVYRAFRADDQYHKQVAVKIVRHGHDSRFVINRFRNERQILASLEHPNIARLLDGGTTDQGVPYFVMELVDGLPIDQYCNHHKLSTAERLKLFGEVCSAVQYAHQRLIVHRDLKPGNILVTEDGIPKLLDFGIAKILDPEETGGQFEPTMTVFRALTPGYASPEQIKGEPITTATDVYSLGVILYELLTGHSPYRVQTRSSQELSRAVCEFDPERPSTMVRKMAAEDAVPAGLDSAEHDSLVRLAKRLSGDLDNIVLMALRKEPSRRYASVEQLSEDIRRHLEDMPVIARKDTARYRASKFFARHRASVIAAAATTIVLIAALVVTFAEARIARRQAELARQERARAERRFNDVRKLANSLIFELHDSIADLPGATKARQVLVTRALEYLDSLSREANGDPSLQRDLAAAYDRVGDVLGYTGQANMGDYTGAAQAYARALAIRESLAASNPGRLDLQVELTGEYWRQIFIRKDSGDLAGALQVALRALPFAQKLAAQNETAAMQEHLSGFYWLTGTVLEAKGDTQGALQDYRQATAIVEPLAADSKAKELTRAHLVGDYNGVAKMLSATGRTQDGIPFSVKATNLMKQLSDANPGSATFREWLAESYNIWSALLTENGDFDGGVAQGRRGLALFKQLQSGDPNNRLAAENTAFAELTIGDALLQQGKFPEALQMDLSAVAIFQPVGGENLWGATGLSSSYRQIGEVYATRADKATSSAVQLEQWRQARAWYEKAQHVWDKNPARAHADALGHDQGTKINTALMQSDAKIQELTARARLQNH